MGKIGFWIFYGINWLVTLLPLRILYISSDFLFLVFYYFPGYRRKVTSQNLKNSFPEKSPEELAVIGKKFYRHLADLFIETLKLTHLSNKELKKRIIFQNPELLENIYNSGHDIILVHSHYNNWEWLAASLPFCTKYKITGIYKPLQNKQFDWFMKNLRSRDDKAVTPMKYVVRDIVENRKKNIRVLYGFVADQTPAKPDIRYWTTFLNQETPVYLGIEKIALKYNMSVVFMNVQKVRRGYFNATFELLFEQTSGLPEFMVTETHVKRLENLIRENPEYWMWTHRRWKHKKQANNG